MVIEEDLPGRYLGFDSFLSYETEDISSSCWTWTCSSSSLLWHEISLLATVRDSSCSKLIFGNPTRLCFYWIAFQEYIKQWNFCRDFNNTLRISWFKLSLMKSSATLHYTIGETVIPGDFHGNRDKKWNLWMFLQEVSNWKIYKKSIVWKSWGFHLKKRIVCQWHATGRFWLTAEYIFLVPSRIKRMLDRDNDCFSSYPSQVNIYNHSSINVKRGCVKYRGHVPSERNHEKYSVRTLGLNPVSKIVPPN